MTRPHARILFEKARPRLMGLAYRLLGSKADAEDAVQDTCVRWLRADHARIREPEAWLTTACTNRCLDILKSAGRTRVDYVGPWLPEPLQTDTIVGPDALHEMAATLSTAFLLLLERLTPKERAAFLLHDIFDCDYGHVAETLGLSETACRQLVSRARRNVGSKQVRMQPSLQQQEELLDAFEAALASGEIAALGDLLHADIELHADGGGKVVAALRVLSGRETVGKFLRAVLSTNWRNFTFRRTGLNGGLGLVVLDEKAVVASVSFGYDPAGQLAQIFIMRNPDKLRDIGQTFGNTGLATRTSDGTDPVAS